MALEGSPFTAAHLNFRAKFLFFRDLQEQWAPWAQFHARHTQLSVTCFFSLAHVTPAEMLLL